MKNNIEEFRQKILELKNKGLNNIEISKCLGIKDNTVSYHLKKLNYVHKQIKCRCANEWCNKDFEVVEYIYNKNPQQFIKCKKCRKYAKVCKVCKTPHNNQGLTCCIDCANILKKESWMKSCGALHNFSRNSSSRKLWESELMEKYNIVNVFQRDDVKNKIKKTLMEKYKVSHPSQIMENYVKRRIIGEKLGILIPLDELTEFQIYKNNVYAFTHYNLRIFGNVYFGEKWRELLGCRDVIKDYNIDHIYSQKNGFLNKIPTYIIGSIVNLRLLAFGENLSKSSRCDISIDELYANYYQFESNDNCKQLLNEMKIKRSKYYDFYIKNVLKK